MALYGMGASSHSHTLSHSNVYRNELSVIHGTIQRDNLLLATFTKSNYSEFIGYKEAYGANVVAIIQPLFRKLRNYFTTNYYECDPKNRDPETAQDY